MQYLDGLPCTRCGWDEASRDFHRIIPERGYTPDNTVPLCPNCHRLVTFGLVPCPDPPLRSPQIEIVLSVTIPSAA